MFGVAGVRIAAVSRDSPYSHKKWAEQQWLDYPLLSDWTGEAVRAFGVAQELDGLVDTPVRSCFLIDGDGVIRGAWRYERRRSARRGGAGPGRSFAQGQG